jgi:hypothetical protein
MNSGNSSCCAGTWLCILGMLLESTRAASQFKIGDGAADLGGTGVVPVSLVTDQAAVGLQFDLTFDPNVLSPGVPVLRDASSKYVVSSSNPANGVQRVLVYSLSNAALTNGIVLNLAFTPRVGSTGRTVSLTASNLIVSSASASAIVPIEMVTGTFATTVDTGAKFTSITKVSESQVELQLTGTIGKSFAVQFSPNLKDWTAFVTNSIPQGGLLKMNAPIPGKTVNRFFRAAGQ